MTDIPAGTTAGAPAPPLEWHDVCRIEEQLVELAGLAGAAVREDPSLGGSLVRWPGRGPALNHLERVRWPADDEEIQARLGALAAVVSRSGDPPAIAVVDGLTKPADLGARLARLGWRAPLRELVLWTRRAPAMPHLEPIPRVEAVTARTVEAYEALERSIFGLDPGLAASRLEAAQRAMAAGRLRAYLLRMGEEPVATARLWSFGDLACVDGIGVVEPARRRRYGSLVTAIATRAALASGHRLAWLEVAGDNVGARDLYERLGYRTAFEWRLFVR